MNYRSIFHNDKVSFGEMQVYPLADSCIHDPHLLQGIWVFDDGFVKGFISIEGNRIAELYVDSFFENQGIGSRLLSFAVAKGCNTLWALDKNTNAQRFYSKHGFVKTGERKLEEGTSEYIIEMKR